MNALDLFAKISLDSTEFKKGLEAAKKAAETVGGVLGAVGKAVGAAFVASAAAVTAFGAKSLQTGQQFDSSMSQVMATMGATVEQLNATEDELAAMDEQERQAAIKVQNEFSALRDFAQEMGSTTVFSATQSADALNYMALAGYDAETSMKMLPNVLNLAAAGSMDLATASDMVTDAQTALGLSLEQTSTMVNQMARTASRSNTSVAQLGDAILTVGGTAQFMTGGTTELNSVLGVLADNGIKGSEAGTHLRNMLLKLSAPTDDGAAALETLGVNIFDAEGHMRSFTEIFPELQSAMSNLTDEQQLTALGKVFNTRDIAAAQALIRTSSDRWAQLGNEIANAGSAAEDMSKVQLDNLTGDITLFKSALEGLQIATSDVLKDSVRPFVKFGSEALSALTKGVKEGGVTGAMKAFGSILSDGLKLVSEMLPTIAKGGMEFLVAFTQGVVESVPSLMSTMTDVVVMLLTMISENLPSLLQSGITALITFISGIAQTIPKLIPVAVDIVFGLVDTLIDNIPELITVGIEAILSLIDGIVEAVPQLLQKMPEIIGNVLDALLNSLPVIIGAGIQLISTLITGIIDALPTLITYVPTIIITVVTTLLANLPMLIEAGLKMIPQIIVGIVQAIPSLIAMVPQIIMQLLGAIVQGAVKLVEAGRELVQKVKEGFKQKIEDAKQWGKDLIQNFKDGIMAKWEALKNGVRNIANGIKNLLGFSEPKEGPLSNFHTYAPDMMKLFAKGIKDNEGVVYDQLKKSFDLDDFMSLNTTTSGQSGSYGNGNGTREDERPIKIVVQSVLDGRVIGENTYDYISGRMRAGELAWQ